VETVSQYCAELHKEHKRCGELCFRNGMLRESCTRNGAVRDMCMMTMRRSILEDSYSRFRSCRNISSIIISHEREWNTAASLVYKYPRMNDNERYAARDSEPAASYG
jgi:hypothetical protein